MQAFASLIPTCPRRPSGISAKTAPFPSLLTRVSTAKAVKLLPVLGKIHTIKPNMLEAALLTGLR